MSLSDGRSSKRQVRQVRAWCSRMQEQKSNFWRGRPRLWRGSSWRQHPFLLCGCALHAAFEKKIWCHSNFTFMQTIEGLLYELLEDEVLSNDLDGEHVMHSNRLFLSSKGGFLFGLTFQFITVRNVWRLSWT